MRVRFQLKEGDFPRRIRFAEWLLGQNRNRAFLPSLIIGDEAGFSMNGEVNTQNVRSYAHRGENPDFHYDRNECRTNVMVWAGLCGNGTMIGPFFFNGSVNGESYLEMLNEKVLPQLLGAFNNLFNTDHFNQLWWAQDGAPAHNLLAVRQWLEEFFRNRIIALHHDIEWPPRSPDLTPCDYFLWGYVKSKLFVAPPESVDDLKRKINDELEAVKRNPELIRRAVRDMIRRARMCIDTGGHHIEHLLENK